MLIIPQIASAPNHAGAEARLHRGLGSRLVRAAAEAARERGAEWLHVDYEPHLDEFYRSCGFAPTLAGLLRLNGPSLT